MPVSKSCGAIFFLVCIASCLSLHIEELSTVVVQPSGTITSQGYPQGYSSSSGETWKFRVPGTTSYTLAFDTVDLDQAGCYDYITIYDDNDWAAPPINICDKPEKPIVVKSEEISVYFQVGSALSAGSRGAGFSLNYYVNDNVPSSTVKPPSSTTKQPTTSTIKLPTSTVANTTPFPSSTVVQSSTSQSGHFPPGSQDDSQCGNPVVKPVITGFDYASTKSYGTERVVNGETSVPHSWPWQASLQGSYGSAYCGGTLVREQWVVTAAHCADLIFIGTYGSDQAVLGMHDKMNNLENVQKIDIVAKFVHPLYDIPDRSHDVALVKLKTPAVLNDDVMLACEAHPDWTYPAGMECVVTGWGVTVEGGNRGSTVLQQAAVQLMSDQECYDLYQEANLSTTPDMQCAGGHGKGACNGDSGGPLNCYINDRWYHMGIVSFGEASCDVTIASVYARVAQLRDFIDDTIASN